MTCTSMFKTSWKERWRTFNSDWRNNLTWRRKWLFEKSFLRYRKQLRKTESRTPQAEKKIWYATKKTLRRCEKNFRIEQRKCKIEKMNRKIVRKNSRAWMTKCRMIERLQTIEVWNFIWWTTSKMIEFETPNDQEAKLIQYLDDYLVELHKQKPNFETRVVWLNWVRLFWIHESIIISKQFWFIYRLSWKHLIDYESNEYFNWYFELFDIKDDFIRASADSIIAILSVNLRPLDFLSSILK